MALISSAPASAAPTAVKPVGPDFCLVQLTAAGVTAAGAGKLRYACALGVGCIDYTFTPGQPLKVAKYEWQMAISGHRAANGAMLFEIYDPAAAVAAATAGLPGANDPRMKAAEANLASTIETIEEK